MKTEKVEVGDRLMRVNEVAEMLQLAPSTIYRLASEDLIPSLKVFGARRFSRMEILIWLQTKGGKARRTARQCSGQDRT
jgi:excisionase family DNA binding protein